ncbi:MAG TPA: hypothetical protein VN739_04855 [Nitrososphaerales archaeon]|nr:hypothetical protein [Nitrososphaerales archaeon]
MAFSLRYRFSQKFRVPARDAFEWCTSYDPNDLTLMGDVGKRSINIISETTLILDDTYKIGKAINRTKKLVPTLSGRPILGKYSSDRPHKVFPVSVQDFSGI